MTKVRSTLALFAALAGAALMVASSQPHTAAAVEAPVATPGWTILGRTEPVSLPPIPFHGCTGVAVAKDHQDNVYGVVFCDHGVVVLLPTDDKAS